MEVPMQNVTNPEGRPSFYSMKDIPVLDSVTFSILFQHHISKVSRYFSSTFRNVPVSAPYKAMLQM
jgi:hypothetical protein